MCGHSANTERTDLTEKAFPSTPTHKKPPQRLAAGEERSLKTALTATKMLVAGNRVLKIVNEVGSSSLSGMSPFGQHAASSIRDAREREKKEMSDLNDRLATYIEKARFETN